MKPSIGTIALYGIPVLLVAGVIALIVFSPSSNGVAPGRASKELVMSCTTDMATTFHIHPMLSITINGEKQVIPANIGIDQAGNCLHPVHTHDDTGKIHVESPVQKDFTLGDFFLVWSKTFNKDQILDNTADATHRIRMTVNGVDSTEYENLVLKDLDNIEIFYEEIPHP